MPNYLPGWNNIYNSGFCITLLSLVLLAATHSAANVVAVMWFYTVSTLSYKWLYTAHNWYSTHWFLQLSSLTMAGKVFTHENGIVLDGRSNLASKYKPWEAKWLQRKENTQNLKYKDKTKAQPRTQAHFLLSEWACIGTRLINTCNVSIITKSFLPIV